MCPARYTPARPVLPGSGGRESFSAPLVPYILTANHQLGLLGSIVDPILEAAGIPLPGIGTIVAVECTDTVSPSFPLPCHPS